MKLTESVLRQIIKEEIQKESLIGFAAGAAAAAGTMWLIDWLRTKFKDAVGKANARANRVKILLNSKNSNAVKKLLQELAKDQSNKEVVKELLTAYAYGNDSKVVIELIKYHRKGILDFEELEEARRLLGIQEYYRDREGILDFLDNFSDNF